MDKSQQQTTTLYQLGSQGSWGMGKLTTPGAISVQMKSQLSERDQMGETNLFISAHQRMLRDQELLDEFGDKEFEENFNSLVNRLNRNLQELNISDSKVNGIGEDISNINRYKMQRYYPRKKGAESQFKTSHLSHIQSLYTHRDQFADRLREFDKCKSLQNNMFIRKKITDQVSYVKNGIPAAQNMFGPLKQSNNNISLLMKDVPSVQELPSFVGTPYDQTVTPGGLLNQDLVSVQQTNSPAGQATGQYTQIQTTNIVQQPQPSQRDSQVNVPTQPSIIFPRDSSTHVTPVKPLNTSHHSFNRMNSPSTDIEVANQNFSSEHSQVTLIVPHAQYNAHLAMIHKTPSTQITPGDALSSQKLTLNERIDHQIQQNKANQIKFKKYLNNAKKIGKDGMPKQLTIDQRMQQQNIFTIPEHQVYDPFTPDYMNPNQQQSNQQQYMMNIQNDLSQSLNIQSYENQINYNLHRYDQSAIQAQQNLGVFEHILGKRNTPVHQIKLDTKEVTNNFVSFEKSEEHTLSGRHLSIVDQADPQRTPTNKEENTTQQFEIQNVESPEIEILSKPAAMLSTSQFEEHQSSNKDMKTFDERINVEKRLLKTKQPSKLSYMEKEEHPTSGSKNQTARRSNEDLVAAAGEEIVGDSRQINSRNIESRSEGDRGQIKKNMQSLGHPTDFSAPSPTMTEANKKSKVQFGFTSNKTLANSKIFPSNEFAKQLSRQESKNQSGRQTKSKNSYSHLPNQDIKDLNNNSEDKQNSSQIRINDIVEMVAKDNYDTLGASKTQDSQQRGSGARIPVQISQNQLSNPQGHSVLDSADSKLSKIEIKYNLKPKIPGQTMQQSIEGGHLVHGASREQLESQIAEGLNDGEKVEGYKREAKLLRAPKQRFNAIQPTIANQLNIIHDQKLVQTLQINKANPYQSKIKGKFNFIQSPISVKASKLIEKSQSISPLNTSMTNNRASYIRDRDVASVKELTNEEHIAIDSSSQRQNQNQRTKYSNTRIRTLQTVDEGIHLDKIIASEKDLTKEMDEQQLRSPQRSHSQLATLKQSEEGGNTDNAVGNNSRNAAKQFPIDQALLDVTLDNNDLISNLRHGSNEDSNFLHTEFTRHLKISQLQLQTNLAIISSLDGFKLNRKQSIEQKKKQEQQLRLKFLKSSQKMGQRITIQNLNTNQQLYRNKYSSVFKGNKVKAFDSAVQTSRKSNSPASERPGSIQQNYNNEWALNMKSNQNINWQDASERIIGEQSESQGADIYDKLMKATIQGISYPAQQIINQSLVNSPQNMAKYNMDMNMEPPKEEPVQPQTHHIKDQILVHVQDSEVEDTVRGPEQVEEMKGFNDSVDATQFDLIACTPSQNVTDNITNNNRKYKSSDPREIYSSAMREKNALLQSKDQGTDMLSKLIAKETSKLTNKQKRNRAQDKQMMTLGVNSLLTLEQIDQAISSQVYNANNSALESYNKKIPFLGGLKTTSNYMYRNSKNHTALDQTQSSGHLKRHVHIKSSDISGQNNTARMLGSLQGSPERRGGGEIETSNAEERVQQVQTQMLRVASNVDRKANSRLEVRLVNNTASRNPSNTTVLPTNMASEENVVAIKKDRSQKHSLERKRDVNDNSNTDLSELVKKHKAFQEDHSSLIPKDTMKTVKTSDKGTGTVVQFQPFKQILIQSPWESFTNPNDSQLVNKDQVQKRKQQSISHMKQYSPTQQLKYHSGGFKGGIQTMTHGHKGFTTSPLKSHYSKDERTRNSKRPKQLRLKKYGSLVRERISTSSENKIKGFSVTQSNQEQSSAYRKSLVKMNNLDMHSQKDFTIEERLNEESFVSKTNLREDSKTIEGGVNDIYRTTGVKRGTMHGVTLRGTAANLKDIPSNNIKIENNLVMTSSHQSGENNNMMNVANVHNTGSQEDD